MKLSRIMLVAVVIGGFCGVALADDTFAPEWRGQPGSTMQKWEFGSYAQVNIPPEGYFNPYGTPLATVSGEFPRAFWWRFDNGHVGVWQFEDYMQFNVPNTLNQDPNSFKWIWIQITYSAGPLDDPLALTVPMPSSGVFTMEKTAIDAYYWHETYLLAITPNPLSEQIYIMPRSVYLQVDEVVIDTICIPEPATFGLFGLGALLYLRRR